MSISWKSLSPTSCFALVFLVIWGGLTNTVHAISFDSGSLNFSTINQSMWGSGSGTVPATRNFSRSWSASTGTIGGITGSVKEVPIFVPIPPYPHDHSSIHFHVQHCHGFFCPADPHPSTPHVHKISTHIHEGEFKQVGTETVDTRTGLAASLSTSGSVSLESSFGLNGGSVDATLDYTASLSLPDTIQRGEFFSIASSTNLAEGTLNTKFPTLTGTIEATFEAEISASIEACVIGFGCSSDGGTLVSIPRTSFELLEMNTDNLPDQTSLFGLDSLAFDITSLNIFADVSLLDGKITLSLLGVTQPPLAINIGNLELDFPDLVTQGSLVGGKVISSNTFDDILRLNVDLDAQSIRFGVPPVGVVLNKGPLTFRGDVLDVDIGPTIDLNQDFELDPVLMLDLAFSDPILARFGSGDTQELLGWGGLLSEIPDFALLQDEVVVTPTYSVMADLQNRTNLGFDLTFSVDAIKGRVSLGPIRRDFSLVDEDFPFLPLGDVDVYNKTFALGGFDPITANPFTISAASFSGGGGGGGGGGGSGGGGGPPPEPVPEPSTLLLFASGIAGFCLYSRYRKKNAF